VFPGPADVAEVFRLDPARPGDAMAALAVAGRALVGGRLVVFPTETVYGIACRPDDPAATEALFAAKARPSRLTLPVLASSAAAAFELGEPNEPAERLASVFWPGPLTMVLRRAEASRDWELGDRGATIGLRVPDHRLTVALLDLAGPLAATSANRSGSPPLGDPAQLLQAFGDVAAVVLLAETGSPDGPTGEASTVVDLTGDPIAVVREGPIGAARVLAVATEPDAGDSVD
jgi:L-threonylcarbamoyladenylate synthase